MLARVGAAACSPAARDLTQLPPTSRRIPLYYEVKFFVLLWMIHPQTQARAPLHMLCSFLLSTQYSDHGWLLPHHCQQLGSPQLLDPHQKCTGLSQTGCIPTRAPLTSLHQGRESPWVPANLFLSCTRCSQVHQPWHHRCTSPGITGAPALASQVHQPWHPPWHMAALLPSTCGCPSSSHHHHLPRCHGHHHHLNLLVYHLPSIPPPPTHTHTTNLTVHHRWPPQPQPRPCPSHLYTHSHLSLAPLPLCPQGALVLYTKFIKPQLAKHASKLDPVFASTETVRRRTCTTHSARCTCCQLHSYGQCASSGLYAEQAQRSVATAA
jgi:hypothetical protein